MLELYHNDMSTCAKKVRLVLAVKNLDWTGHHLSLRQGDQHKPEYLKLHPGGVVPTLIHDGVVIRESTIINEYLDDAFPENPLRPISAAGRWRMRLLTKQLDEGVHAATGMISSSGFSSPITRRRNCRPISRAFLIRRAARLGVRSWNMVWTPRCLRRLLKGSTSCSAIWKTRWRTGRGWRGRNIPWPISPIRRI